MLTADLVEVQRREDALSIVRLSPKRRALLVELLTKFHAIAIGHVGRSRAEILSAMAEIECPSKEAKLRKAAQKLVDDVCTFEEADGASISELRAQVFRRAAFLRRELSDGELLDRREVLAAIEREFSLPEGQIDERLFSDLREAQRLLHVSKLDPRELGETFELLELEAILLRAINVTIDLEGGAASFRRFHRELRFRGLLFRVEATDDGHRFTIDGPFSLFESVTKYGLELALAFRAARRVGKWSLQALVRWPSAKGGKRSFIVRARSSVATSPEREKEHPYLTAMAEEIGAIHGDWQVARSENVFPLAGVGLVVPDLVLTHKSGARVFVELLGFWSRDAVWTRIEQAGGLPVPFVFVVSKKLRVSEEALPNELPASLYVFANAPRGKKLLEHANTLVERDASKSQALAAPKRSGRPSRSRT